MVIVCLCMAERTNKPPKFRQIHCFSCHLYEDSSNKTTSILYVACTDSSQDLCVIQFKKMVPKNQQQKNKSKPAANSTSYDTQTPPDRKTPPWVASMHVGCSLPAASTMTRATKKTPSSFPLNPGFVNGDPHEWLVIIPILLGSITGWWFQPI